MFYFLVCYFVLSFSLCNVIAKTEREEVRDLLIAKLLMVNVNNKATGMLTKSEPLEAYPYDVFRWNLLG